jgi:hypothetical protein
VYICLVILLLSNSAAPLTAQRHNADADKISHERAGGTHII